MNAAAILAISAGAGVLLTALEPFRRTMHGLNPWSVDGVVGVLTIKRHVETIASRLGARYTSAFRSEAVQRAIYDGKRKNPDAWAVVEAGAKRAGLTTEAYVAKLASGSRHHRGLACDFVPGRHTMADLGAEIFRLAKAGTIGPVKKVLDERDHIHVEWYGPAEQAKPAVMESL